MKMTLFLMIFGFLFLSVVTISAQSQNFSGNWQLDADRIKSPFIKPDLLTMKVSQNGPELKIESTFRTAGSEEAQTRTYNLEGKQTFAEVDDYSGKIKANMTADLQNDGKLILNLSRLMTYKNDERFTVERKSVWELENDGKTLKVTEYMNIPGEKAGNHHTSGEGVIMYFTRR